MTIQTLTEASELFAQLDSAAADLAALRKRDLNFLHGQQLQDPFEDILIRNVEPTSFDIYRENFQDDGTLSLRVGVELSIQSAAGENFGIEQGVLWLTTDGVDVEMELADIEGARYFDFELEDFAAILSRLT